MQLLIELPSREEQIAFNRRRWEELCADRELAKWPGKVETNAHGQILMMPPPVGPHSYKTSIILIQFHSHPIARWKSVEVRSCFLPLGRL